MFNIGVTKSNRYLKKSLYIGARPIDLLIIALPQQEVNKKDISVKRKLSMIGKIQLPKLRPMSKCFFLVAFIEVL